MEGWTSFLLCCTPRLGITVIQDTRSLGKLSGFALLMLPGVEMIPSASVSVPSPQSIAVV